MPLYIARDIEVQTNGDIVINGNGDISVATAKESHKHALKFMLSTDLDEMTATPYFGANLGALMGETDPETVASSIGPMVHEALREQGLLATEDIQIRAYQIDTDNIIIFVDMNGHFVENDGSIDYNPSISMRFLFPYKEAELIALETDD